MTDVVRALLLPFAACSLFACGGGEETGAGGGRPRADGPSALLITLDTTIPEALDCYESDQGVTPHLAAFAREAIVFDNARSVAPQTLPAHTSMLTGLYPPRHTVHNNGHTPVPRSADTLAERARAAGYRTAAFLSADVLALEFGLGQGFEVYEAPKDVRALGGGGTENEVIGGFRVGPETASSAVRWLEGRSADEPFFLWVHFFDPHLPFEPAPEYLAQAGGVPYLGEVAQMDAAVGRVLAAFREATAGEPAWVVVVGDHGEDLGRHSEPAHTVFCYDVTIRVPLIVQRPDGVGAGTRRGEIVSVVDVFPTLVNGLDLGRAGSVDGLDLLGELPVDRGVYFESYMSYLTYGWSHIAGRADAEGKYLHSSKPEYYDLVADPMERTNLYERGDPRVQAHLRAMRAIARAPKLQLGENEDLDEKTRAMVEALGYAGGTDPSALLPSPIDDSDLPHPRDHMDEVNAFFWIWDLRAQGRTREAIGAIQEIVRKNPTNGFARVTLGKMLHQEGLHPDAVRELRAAIALNLLPSRGRDKLVHTCLGRSLAKLGEHGEAAEALEKALALDPGDAEVFEDLVEALEAAGRGDEVEAWRARMSAAGAGG